jgi:hypothetical protein
VSWALWAFAGLLILGALLAIGSIGKPRKPLTHGQAAWVTVYAAAEAGVMIAAGIRLAR